MGRTSNAKQKLIDTASELIWRNSFGSVSVDDICNTAEVKKGSFYHYFKSKVDLAVAAMDAKFVESQADFDAAFSPSIPPIQRFERLAELVIDVQRQAATKYGQVCGCPFMTLGSEMAGQDEVIRDKADQMFRRYERYYQSALSDLVTDGLLPKDTDTKALAGEVYAYSLGQVMMARVQNSLHHLERDFRNGLFRIIGLADLAKQAEDA